MCVRRSACQAIEVTEWCYQCCPDDITRASFESLSCRLSSAVSTPAQGPSSKLKKEALMVQISAGVVLFAGLCVECNSWLGHAFFLRGERPCTQTTHAPVRPEVFFCKGRAVPL